MGQKTGFLTPKIGQKRGKTTEKTTENCQPNQEKKNFDFWFCGWNF